MDTVHTGFPNFGFQSSETQNSKKKKSHVDLGRYTFIDIFSGAFIFGKERLVRMRIISLL